MIFLTAVYMNMKTLLLEFLGFILLSDVVLQFYIKKMTRTISFFFFFYECLYVTHILRWSLRCCLLIEILRQFSVE